MLAFVNSMAAFEGMLLGVKAGVDPQILHDIVQSSSGASWAMRQFPHKIFAGDFAPGFTIDLAHKDLRLALELGDEFVGAVGDGQRVHQPDASGARQWPRRE